LKALQKEPDKRYQSISAMAADLDKALGRTPSSGTKIPTPHVFTPFAQPQRQHRQRQTALLVAVVTMLVAVLAISILANQPRSIPLPTIQTDVEGGAEDLVPTSAEIEMAQRALGNGFIAYITCNQTSEYHATQAREMGDFARQYGLDYRVYDSDTDEYHQVAQIERARTDGAKALIICPLDADLLDKPMRSVDDANLPVVMLSQDLPSYGGVEVVGDEFEMGYQPGQLAGKIIADEMNGKADVIILDYPDLPHLILRADGLEAGVLSQAPDAHIVGRYLGATPDFARESVSKLLDEGIHFDVIVSINDAGSFGAIEALEDADIPPEDVVITSVDAEQLALRYIREGHYMRGTIQIGRERFSRAAIDAITRLLAGGTLPERILVPPGDVITTETLTN
jgi:ribose transport system substrate-binding protein